MDFEGGSGTVYAREGDGFDPIRVMAAVRDAGFGPGAPELRAVGRWTTVEELPALQLPGEPAVLILGGGQQLDELLAAELPSGARLRVWGTMHPSHADKPAGVTVDGWELLDAPGPSR